MAYCVTCQYLQDIKADAFSDWWYPDYNIRCAKMNKNTFGMSELRVFDVGHEERICDYYKADIILPDIMQFLKEKINDVKES